MSERQQDVFQKVKKTIDKIIHKKFNGAIVGYTVDYATGEVSFDLDIPELNPTLAEG